MRLLWSSRSPFARKVLVVVHELGLQGRVTVERVLVSARSATAEVMRVNPLNQIPTLVLPDGTALFDSAVIVEYLDATFGLGELVPAAPGRRWPVLRLQALGDGLMTLNVLRRAERERGAAAAADYVEALRAKTAATLDRLEREVAALATLSAGNIAVACGLAHLDFRFPEEGWRAGRPGLAGFFEAIGTRASFRATIPEDTY